MDSVLLEIKNGVAHITLNRPEKYNALTREMLLSLQSCLDQSEIDKSVRCVLITGAGKGFSAGQDLSQKFNPRGDDMKKMVSELYNPVIHKIRNLTRPVVAAVNGIAAGAGANIALACDIVLATESAAFIQAFSKIGLIPDSGGTYFLPRLVGFQKAAGLMMLADKVSAAEAVKMGMIYKYFPDDSFQSETQKIVASLAEMPTKALAFTKEALNKSLSQTLDEQLETEGICQEKALSTQDFMEGVMAFAEKRKPVFKGR